MRIIILIAFPILYMLKWYPESHVISPPTEGELGTYFDELQKKKRASGVPDMSGTEDPEGEFFGSGESWTLRWKKWMTTVYPYGETGYIGPRNM